MNFSWVPEIRAEVCYSTVMIGHSAARLPPALKFGCDWYVALKILLKTVEYPNNDIINTMPARYNNNPHPRHRCPHLHAESKDLLASIHSSSLSPYVSNLFQIQMSVLKLHLAQLKWIKWNRPTKIWLTHTTMIEMSAKFCFPGQWSIPLTKYRISRSYQQ